MAVNFGLTDTKIWALAVSGTSLFAGTYRGGVFLSTNNGKSWTAASSGLPKNTEINCLGASGTYLFAGTDEGVFLSTNDGKSWTVVNKGLPENTEVNCLAVSGTNLLAGIDEGGVWRLPLSEVSNKKR